MRPEGRDVVFSYHKQAPEGVQEVALTATNLDELDADIESADRSKINVLAVEVSVDGASYARAEVSGPRGHIARHDWELAGPIRRFVRRTTLRKNKEGT